MVFFNSIKKKRLLISCILLVIFSVVYLKNRNFSVLINGSSRHASNNYKVSIIGDSISSYSGITKGPYYPKGNVDSVDKTWWMQTINSLNFTFASNTAWGGTTITYVPSHSSTNPESTCFYHDNRLDGLDDNGTPNYIFIFGGTNDMNIKVDIGSFSNTTDTTTLIGAYYTLINKLQSKYPNAKLISVIPMKTPNLTDSEYNNYYQAFKQIFNNNHIPYVDLSKVSELKQVTGCTVGSTCDTAYFIDRLHPNNSGMTLIKNEMVKLFNKKVTVKFYRNYNSSDNNYVTETYNFGEFNQHFEENFTRNGYTLKGWSVDRNSSTIGYRTTSNVYDWWIQTTDSNYEVFAVWEPNVLNIKYDVNGGTVKEHTNSEGLKIGQSGSLVTIDGSTNTYTLKYGESLPTSGLANYNNEDLIQITRNGYSTIKDQEWKDKNGKVYSQTKQYSASDFKDLCDVSKTSCDVTFYVNWKKSIDIPTTSYCTNPTYNGKSQALVSTATGFTWTNSNRTDAGSQTVSANLSANNVWSDRTAEPKSITCKINAYNLSNSTIAAIQNKTYTGSEIKPTLDVTALNKTLTENTDYTVSYSDNLNTGTAKAIITGKGNFTGTNSRSFTIEKANIADSTIGTISSYTYDGSAKTPEPVIKMGTKTLVKNTDYTLSYKNNTNAGIATVTVTGKGNYTGTNSKEFVINNANASNLTVSTISNQIYSGNEIKPTPSIKIGSKTLVKDTDYTLSYKNNINVGTATLTVTSINKNIDGAKNVTFNIVAHDIADSTIGTISSYTYDGSAKTPEPVIKMGTKTLVKNTDYTLSYKNNTNAGTATVTVTGKGNYSGTNSKTFTINPLSISNSTISNVSNQTYSGNEIKPTPSVIINGKTLVKDTDYTLSYKNNINTGTATVTITGKGNYSGTNSQTFTINPLSITNATFSSISNQVYLGSEIKPEPKITFNNKVLVKNTDYTLSYKNNINVGKATIVITGKGNFNGTKSLYFEIEEGDISTAAVGKIKNQIYSGEEIKPEPTIKVNNRQLEKNKDYVLSYKNNIEMGTATITITGINNYSGYKQVNFKITEEVITNSTVSSIENYYYNGEEIKPEPVVTYNNKKLVKDVDYELEYSNNINAGVATITITGIGENAGEKIINFNILKPDIKNSSISSVPDYIYDGTSKTPEVELKIGNRLLIKNTDYVLKYSNNKNAGEASILITGKNNYTGNKEIKFNITKVDLSDANITGVTDKEYTGSEVTIIPTVTVNNKVLVMGTDYLVTYTNNTNIGEATMTITGNNNYIGSKTVKYNIKKANIANAEVEEMENQIYNGKAQKPTPKISLNGKELIKDIDYTLSYSNNIDMGVATMTITGKGNYINDKTINFIISDKSSVKKLKSMNVGDKSILNTFTTTVPYDTATINLTAEPLDEKATILGTGEKNLKEGENIFEITVIAEDGTEKKYPLIITRMAYIKSDNNKLASLKIGNFDLSKTFKEDINKYTLTVPNDITSIDISPKVQDEKATILGAGNKELVEGENIFEITVVAENETINVYTIKIIRESKNNENKSESNINNPPTHVDKIGLGFIIIIFISIGIFMRIRVNGSIK